MNAQIAAKIMVDALEKDASPEDLILAFNEECQRRCPAHGPTFLERMKSAIDSLFH